MIMINTSDNSFYLKLYIQKQNNFKKLVKEVQRALNTKEYIKEGYSFNEYIRIKWNISK